MVGRGTLLVIIGFAMIFGIAGQYWDRESTSAVTNYIQYYGQANVYNIAVAGANIGCDSLFNDINSTGFPVSGKFSGGNYTVTTLTVPGEPAEDMLQSVGTYSDYTGDYADTVQVLLTRRSYSQWEFFSVRENGIYWKTGDTVTGPMATDDSLYVSGSPTFEGQVSAKLGISKSLPATPKFLAGFQSGVGYNMASVTPSASQASRKFTNSNTQGSYDVYLNFSYNSTTKQTDVSFYSTSTQGYGWNRTTTRVPATGDSVLPLSGFAPNGVVAVSNGDVHVQGVLAGQLTVVAQQGAIGASNSGNILIDNNITYQNNPLSDPSSTDMLGLVAQNNITLTASQQTVDIDAALYAENGSFSYSGASSTYLGQTAYIDLLGSIANYSRGGVGEFNTLTGQMIDGYNKDYVYDKRLASSSPPDFPYTGTFGVLTWRETPPSMP